MDEAQREMVIHYSDRNPGEMLDWKKDADRYFGREQAVELWRELAPFLPPPDKDLVFLSPAANYQRMR